MNFRAKHWPEGVFVREGGGGGGGVNNLSSNMYRQLVQYKKNLYYIFVISLSAIIYMYS